MSLNSPYPARPVGGHLFKFYALAPSCRRCVCYTSTSPATIPFAATEIREITRSLSTTQKNIVRRPRQLVQRRVSVSLSFVEYLRYRRGFPRATTRRFDRDFPKRPVDSPTIVSVDSQRELRVTHSGVQSCGKLFDEFHEVVQPLFSRHDTPDLTMRPPGRVRQRKGLSSRSEESTTGTGNSPSLPTPRLQRDRARVHREEKSTGFHARRDRSRFAGTNVSFCELNRTENRSLPLARVCIY